MVERDFSDISDTIAQIMLDGTLLGPGNDDYSDEEYYWILSANKGGYIDEWNAHYDRF